MLPKVQDFALKSFMDYLTIEKGCSSNTIKGYTHDLESLLDFLVNNGLGDISMFPWDKVGLIHLRGFLAHLYNQRENKTSSIHRRVCSIKAFFRYLQANRIIQEDPASELQYPKRPSSLPKYIAKDSIQTLVEGAKNPLHQAIIEVLYSTGARCNELRSMNLEDINFEEGTVTIRGGKGGKDRIVLLSKRAGPILQEYIQNYRAALISKASSRKELPKDSHQAVFVSNRGTRISNRTIQHFIAKLSEDSGIKRTTPHMLRHSFASHLVMKQTNIRVVQQLLGHASLDTTQIYANVSAEFVKSEFQDKLNF